MCSTHSDALACCSIHAQTTCRSETNERQSFLSKPPRSYNSYERNSSGVAAGHEANVTVNFSH